MSNTSLPSYEIEWLTQVYRAAEEAWANPPNIPPTYPELIPSFNNEVYCYLTGKISAQEALNIAAQDWIKAVSG
jgi:carbohydrate ABC transporter substrate-binding protein, CUT1 family (TC 3.A.1.1.-)